MRIIDLYLEHKHIDLDEANLKKLYSKVISDTPKRAERGIQLKGRVRYFGLSKDGTLNFKVASQSQSGRFYYVYIEAPDILKLSDIIEEGDHLTQADLNRLLTMQGFRVHCGCPDWLYYAFQYMATQGNYEIEPETRAPKRNNVVLVGATCKHLFAVINNIYENSKIRELLVHDIENYLRMLLDMDYEDYQQLNHAKQIQQQNRAVKWKNKPSDYMNDYFARKAKHHSFLDDHDIKKSLKKEITKFIRTNPQADVDDFLRSYFQMTQKAFAEDMKIPEDAVEDYFNELGFEDKKNKAIAKQEQLAPKIEEPKEPQGVNQGILTKDSEILKESKYYKNEEEAKEAYHKYIKGHVANVQEALKLLHTLEIPFVEEHYDELTEICSVHDASKYSDAEFFPYLHHFYPTNEKEANLEEEFDHAVTLHVLNNRHHWNCQDWIDYETGSLKGGFDKDVYLLYTVERICDFLAMAYQHSESPYSYWDDNKETFTMPDYAFDFMDDIIHKVPKDFKLVFKVTRGDLD